MVKLRYTMQQMLTLLVGLICLFCYYCYSFCNNNADGAQCSVVDSSVRGKNSIASSIIIFPPQSNDTSNHWNHTTAPLYTNGYRVMGSIEVDTMENSIFEWKGTLYLLENIGCLYSQHAWKWDPGTFFANASYVRIRDFASGKIVANLSSTVGYGFVTPFPDYRHQQLWLFGSKCNRCAKPNKEDFGCDKDRGITAWKLLDIDKPNTTQPQFQRWRRQRIPLTQPTYNVQVTAADKTKNLSYVMIAEPFTIYVKNNIVDNNLMTPWRRLKAQPPKDVPVGGPSIRHVGGFFYILTGGFRVELIRTKDFVSWERSPNRPFIQPTRADAQVAPYNGFPAVQEIRGFPPMSCDQCWTKWDWNSNDADVAYLDPSNSSNSNKTWIIWGAGTQGKIPKPPLTLANHCTNVVAVANMSLANLFQHHFLLRDTPTAVQSQRL